MDIRQLRYFVAIVDAGSLSKASLKLHIAQPSLSQQLAAMEDDLGTPLLVRHAQGVSATESGKTLYKLARQLLGQFDQLRAEVGSSGGQEVGRVTVGLPTSVAAVLAVPLVREIRREFPGIYLHIVESMSANLSDLLANGRLDMAVLFRDAESIGIAVQPLLVDTLAFYGRLPSGAPGQHCDVRDLEGVPMVLPAPGNGLRELIERMFARAGSRLNVVADLDALPAMLGLVATGEVGTILSRSLSQLGHEKGLDVHPLTVPGVRRTVSLCWATSGVTSSATEAVKKCLAAMCTSLRTSGHWEGSHAIDDPGPPATPATDAATP